LTLAPKPFRFCFFAPPFIVKCRHTRHKIPSLHPHALYKLRAGFVPPATPLGTVGRQIHSPCVVRAAVRGGGLHRPRSRTLKPSQGGGDWAATSPPPHRPRPGSDPRGGAGGAAGVGAAVPRGWRPGGGRRGARGPRLPPQGRARRRPGGRRRTPGSRSLSRAPSPVPCGLEGVAILPRSPASCPKCVHALCALCS